MPGLWFSGFRAWGFNPARTLLTLVGLALGVSLLMGTVLAVDSLDQAIALQSQRLAGHVPLQVRALSDDGLNPDDLAALRALPGVDRATPTLEKRVFYRTAAGRGFASVLGFNPDQLGAQQDYPLADGRYVDGRAAPEVLLVADWAAENHLGIGAQIELITGSGLEPFTVVGLLREAGPGRTEFGRVAIVSEATMAASFNLGARLTTIGLSLDGSRPEAEIVDEVRQHLSGDYQLVSAAQLASDLRDHTGPFASILLFLALVGLGVGGFLIHNTLSMTVAERVHDIGLLRALGVRGRQIMAMMLVEILALGAAACTLGVLLGWLVARALVRLTASAQGLPLVVPMPNLLQVAGVALLGLAVTLGFSLAPWLRAGRLTAMDALRRPVQAQSRPVHQRASYLGLALMLGGLAALWFARLDGGLLVGIVLVLVGTVLSARLAISLVVAPLSSLAEPWLGSPVRLARGNLAHLSNRTVLTVGALTAGLTLMLALAGLFQSVSTAGDEWVDDFLPFEAVIVSPAPQRADLAHNFNTGPEIRSFLAREATVHWQGRTVAAIGLEAGAFARGLRLVEGDPKQVIAAMASGGAVLVPRDAALRQGWKLGDTLPLQGEVGTVSFRVAGILAHSFPAAGNDEGALLMSWEDLGHLRSGSTFKWLLVSAPGGLSRPEAAQLGSTAERYGMELVPTAAIKAQLDETLARLYRVLSWTLLLAIVLAGLGIANTMMMNVFEHRRELGTMRALGMTQRQLQHGVLAEGLLMGLVAWVVSLPLGLALGYELVHAVRETDFNPTFVFPASALVANLVYVVAVSGLAALYPARWVSRARLLDSLRYSPN